MEQNIPDKILPLCVDLDHTLISTDIIWEQVLELLRRNPLNFFLIVIWFLGGKKFLKEKLAEAVELNLKDIPFRRSIIDFIREKKKTGAKIYLVTATNQKVANKINHHLKLFDEVFGSSLQINLRGKYKANFLREKFGIGGFEYIGDSRKDLPIWELSGKNYLVSPSNNLKKKVSKIPNFGGIIGIESVGTIRYLKMIRIHQWFKNFLLFLPPILAHSFEFYTYFKVFLAFLSFSFVASGIYILNDFFDLKSDRLHPFKKFRPIASGNVDMTTATIIFFGLLTFGILFSTIISKDFMWIILLYIFANFLYTVSFKSIPIVDIFLLSFFYALRLNAGGVATSISVSNWLLAFSLFFFLSLSALKRYSELIVLNSLNSSISYDRPYHPTQLDFIQIFGISSAFSSIVIFILYINSPTVLNFYKSPSFLWIVAFLLLFWLLNAWHSAKVGKITGDPIIFFLKDKISYLTFLMMTLFWIFSSIGI
ncbi:MAG: UbiA family prenyltransferase [Candidatus Kapaibacteriales bacterium]